MHTARTTSFVQNADRPGKSYATPIGVAIMLDANCTYPFKHTLGFCQLALGAVDGISGITL